MGVILPGSDIPAVDRDRMRASLEVRTPFLSRERGETIAEMDQRTFLAFGQKNLLRQILCRYIPKDHVRQLRRRFDFPPPLSRHAVGCRSVHRRRTAAHRRSRMGAPPGRAISRAGDSA